MRIAAIEPGGRGAAWIVVTLAALLAAGLTFGLTRAPRQVAQCGPGFLAVGAHCAVPADRCPPPLEGSEAGCDAPLVRVAVPAVVTELGPSDWEAEGRVVARTLHTEPFVIDAFEATVGQVFCPSCPLPSPQRFAGEPASHAAAGLSLDEARTVCAARGGRLPTGDEWTVLSAVAAPSPAPGTASPASAAPAVLHRYPWGDTGAVCRRAAWGLSRGPCSSGASGPDPVGAHPDGTSPAGVYDLAGNVAEWTEDGFVRGGSWQSGLAEELRVWARARLEVPALSHDLRVGVRCAYASRAPLQAPDRAPGSRSAPTDGRKMSEPDGGS